MTGPRIAPLEPPYEPEVAAALERWMPPGVAMEPLALFRTLQRHPELSSRMRALGAGLLGHGRLAPRDRELVIHRTSARAGARYEWGVHAAFYGPQVGLDAEQLRSTAAGTPADACWSEHDARILRAVDELYDHGTISPGLFAELSAELDTAQLLELTVCAGFYRTIAYVIAVAGTEEEGWAMPYPG